MTFEEAAENIWIGTHYEVLYDEDCLEVIDDYFQKGRRIIGIYGRPKNVNDISIDWSAIDRSFPLPSEIAFIFDVIKQLTKEKNNENISRKTSIR